MNIWNYVQYLYVYTYLIQVAFLHVIPQYFQFLFQKQILIQVSVYIAALYILFNTYYICTYFKY
jgi:hypothetical protein